MTNTKFRRRALISSVAMLLVALVALGSATFAWFTENPQVKAEGITAQAQTSTGLEIKTTTDSSWKEDTANLMNDGNSGLKLVPAYAKQAGDGTTQSPYSITWLSASAEKAESWAPASGAKWAAAALTPIDAQDGVAATGSGIYHEEIYIKCKNLTEANNPTVYLNGFSITQHSGAPEIYAGVTAIVAVKGQIKAVKKLGSDAIKNYDTAATDTTIATPSGNYGPMFGSTNIELGTAGAVEADWLKVDVYVYLDGTDAAVKTNNAIAGQLIDKITLSFTK